MTAPVNTPDSAGPEYQARLQKSVPLHKAPRDTWIEPCDEQGIVWYYVTVVVSDTQGAKPSGG